MNLTETWEDRFAEFFQPGIVHPTYAIKAFVQSELLLQYGEVKSALLKTETIRLNEMLLAQLRHVEGVIEGLEEPLDKKSLIGTLRRCLT